MTALDKPYKYVLAAALLTFVYVCTGMLGLTMAVPPGYATVFWPPSGFAVAAVYLFGYRMSLGVFWGAFLTHVLNYIILAEPNLDVTQYLNGICIALGATFQALLAAYLINRFVSPFTRLESFVEIFKFSFLSGPVSCVLSASIGALTLLFSGSIPMSNLPYTWMNWYVGDILGILVFSPILIILFAGNGISLRRKLSTSLPIMIVFSVVIFTFFTFREAEENIRIKKFQTTADLIKKELDYKLSDHFGMLKSVQALYASSEFVDFHEFSVFAQHTIDETKLMGGIAYAPLVKSGPALRRLLGEVRAMGMDDFRLKDFDDKEHNYKCDPFCTPIVYAYPAVTHNSVAGLDLSKNYIRANAIQKVLETKRLNISEKIVLARSKQNGFLSVLPIFENIEDNNETQNIVGFIFGGSSYDIVFSSVLAGWEQSGIHLRLYDEDVMIYDTSRSEGVYSALTSEDNPFVFSYTEEVAGRTWRFEFVMDADEILANVNWNIWFALAASLFFTFFTTVFLLAVTGQTAAVENIVIQKTKELSDNNKFLRIIMDSVPDLVFVKNRFSQIVQANKSFLELYPPEKRSDVIGRTGFDNFPDSEVKLFKQKDRQAFEDGYSETFEPITNFKGETRNHFMRKIAFKTDSNIEYLLSLIHI